MKASRIALSLSLLTLLLGASALSACGDSSGTTEATGTTADTAAVTTAETEAVYIKANVPSKDFGGETFTFYGRIYEGAWSANDIFSHEEDGEQINDAVYARTAYIEDTYNVKLDAIESGDGTITSYAKTYITAGDTSFQAIVCDAYDAGALSVEGMLLDLNEVSNIDLSQEWWAQATNASLSIANRQFYATGDLFIIDNKATRMFFFNKDIINELDLENPYDLVEQNKWTIEKYIELSEAAIYDLNGDGQLTRDTDRYGTMAQTTLGAILYYASGNLLTDKDANDLPYAVCGTESALSVMDGISGMISGLSSISLSGETGVSGGTHPDNVMYFMDGRVLFAPEVLMHIETMRDCEVDVGIVPPPKYDEAQDAYICYADGWCVNVVSIPSTNVNADDAGLILEAMAADSLNNLTPAYFDVVLTDKYARDEQSVAMLDLILDSVVMDNANIFSWGSIESTVADAIYKGGAIASSIEKKLTGMQKAMDKTVTAIEAIEQ
ncbi:MAG: extracellular solute-binding protein [Clostridia bacterium]|nr:extracellular solute-binding protein [Clostridia bacterium]